MRDGFKRLLSVFIALLFVGFGGALLYIETQSLIKARDSLGWSPTDGIVLHTDYERTSAGRRASNAPYVTYSYQVQGKEYTSNVRSFGDSLSEPEMFEQYPNNRRVTVFYDPEHPQEATLLKGLGTGTIAGVRYAQFMLVLALAFLAYVAVTEVKKRRNSQQVGSSNGG